jgi:hypothetical protein
LLTTSIEREDVRRKRERTIESASHRTRPPPSRSTSLCELAREKQNTGEKCMKTDQYDGIDLVRPEDLF